MAFGLASSALGNVTVKIPSRYCAFTLSPATAVGVITATLIPTARYLRCVVTLTGSDPQANVAVLVGQQKKVM